MRLCVYIYVHTHTHNTWWKNLEEREFLSISFFFFIFV